MNDPLFLLDSYIDDNDSDPDYVQPSETSSNNSRSRLVNISHSDFHHQAGPSSQNDAENTFTVIALPKIIMNKGKKRVKNTS